jgi:hypothetical protein
MALKATMERLVGDSKPAKANWRMLAALAIAALLQAFGPGAAQERQKGVFDLNTVLMKSTYLIQGPKKGADNELSFGAAFLVEQPTADKAKQYYVLVTARHVLDEIDSDTATLLARKSNGEGDFSPYPMSIRIRENGKNDYVKLDGMDIAALHADMPADLGVTALPASLLADDDAFDKYEIHPGDQLRSLGFPLYVSSQGGFPILRTGIVASYPIIPTDINKVFYFEFKAFEGASGGPVYFVDRDRVYGGKEHPGETIQFVAGLVASQIASKVYNNQFIDVATVIPSSYILKTIELLPGALLHK